RLSRSHPNNSLVYTDEPSGKMYTIPPGTPVGYSSYFLHRDPTIFPEPDEFRPERWLNISPLERQKLKAHANSFGRGTRQCMGVRLAYAELYLTLGHMFRPLGRKWSWKIRCIRGMLSV
ncbi:cytochrome P450, partial [Macroventuria anomochaeta]